eukprot:scpid111403/ scgid6521/ 
MRAKCIMHFVFTSWERVVENKARGNVYGLTQLAIMRLSSAASTFVLWACLYPVPVVFGESASENGNMTTQHFISNICSPQSNGGGTKTHFQGFGDLQKPLASLFLCILKEKFE